APPTPAIRPLSLHDALPISRGPQGAGPRHARYVRAAVAERAVHWAGGARRADGASAFQRVVRASREDLRSDRHGLHDYQRVLSRSEEHTSELQSLAYLVCRL